jgi:jumonji domain-containing protein 2
MSSSYESIPVFRPTLAQMSDFSKYLSYLEKKGAANCGLCKIVPPKDWRWKADMERARALVIDTPIQQCVSGRAGLYTVSNLVQGALSVREFEALALAKQPAEVDEMLAQHDYAGIERKFWKSLTTTSDPPMYGADTVATLFQDAKVAFNVNRLDCMLKKCGVDLPGVTQPMIYVGMFRSFFSFHTEDLNMFSINFLHRGSAKMWYAIPASAANRVEALAKSCWPDETCPEMLRHKTKLFSPSQLQQAGIPFARGVQHEGEIMVTWPQSFHGGFNTGFNVAESVNFVPPSLWRFFMKHARLAKVCNCRPDSVTINLDWLQTQFVRGRPAAAHSAAAGGERGRGVPEQGEEEGEDVENQEPPPVDRKRLVKNCKVGDHVELWCGSEWVPVSIVTVLEEHVKVHEAGARAADDIWVALDSQELRRGMECEAAAGPKPAVAVAGRKKKRKLSDADDEDRNNRYARAAERGRSPRGGNAAKSRRVQEQKAGVQTRHQGRRHVEKGARR